MKTEFNSMGKQKILKARWRKIMTRLEEAGAVGVTSLSRELDVSPITIRRDLDSLNEQGLLMRTHGGAKLSQDMRDETRFAEKGQTRMLEKIRIGEAVARLIDEDATLFVNSGSTTLEVIKNLRGKRARIFTNSIAALEVPRDPAVELFLAGGEYRESSQSLVGEIAQLTLSQVYSDFTILGVNGIDPEAGLTSSVQQETSINRLMAERCTGRTIIAADSSKLGVVSNFHSAPLDVVDILVTDDAAPPELILAFKEFGIEVILCSLDNTDS